MSRNQLPEGVGKKIVEALKRQAEADIKPAISNNNSNQDFSYSDINDISDVDFESLPETSTETINENAIIEDFNNSFATNEDQSQTAQNVQNASFSSELTFNKPNEQNENNAAAFNETNNPTKFKMNSVVNDNYSSENNSFNNEQNTMNYNGQSSSSIQTFNTNMPLSEDTKKTTTIPIVTVRIPTNVAVLRNLISTLPVGVTKQTGAQIIRQTLEAMGLPMAGVLKEAQEVQEELNTNTRECMLKIQEYKTNIMQLEQSVQEYQKYITQINDLVSLFLLTDRK